MVDLDIKRLKELGVNIELMERMKEKLELKPNKIPESTKLKEILNSEVEVEPVKSEHSSDRIYHFSVKDLDYKVTFSEHEGIARHCVYSEWGAETLKSYGIDPNKIITWYDLYFSQETNDPDNKHNFGLTGTGNTGAVFSGVKKCLEDFISFDYDFQILTFTAKEQNRASMYTIFAKILSKESGFPYETHYYAGADTTYFFFFNTNKIK